MKRLLPISLVATSFNEATNAPAWCASLLQMRELPSELVIADSESTDGTVDLLRALLAGSPFPIVVLSGKCGIAEGRNRAVAAARFEHVAITDFGVTFDQCWLSELYAALTEAEWVGGVYKITWKNTVQRSFSRLFDIPANALSEAEFLPSSRSFGIRKTLFEASGGYATTLVLGEDTEFVFRLKRLGASYKLARSAVVGWLPRETLTALIKQSYRYAYWDGVAGQNSGRVAHVIFLAVLVVPPVAITAASPAWGPVALAVSASALWAKASWNTYRSSHHGLATFRDAMTYAVATIGSCAGYAAGVMSKALRAGWRR
jgi:glycosyltransferase involved in cell wall biosynthesis